MAEVVFVVNVPGWNAAFKSWNGSPMGTYMKRKNLLIKAHATALAPGPHKPPKNTSGIPFGKGALQAGIITTEHHAPSGDLEGHVVAVPKQGLFVHEGTRGPYVIKPRIPGRRLKFFWHKVGHVVYPKRVLHPGIRIKQPFLKDALDRSI